MLVWERIATGSKNIGGRPVDLEYIHQWLQNYDINACELESKVGYLGIDVQCNKNCSTCLLLYLRTEIKGCIEKTNTGENMSFKSITDEFGEQQLTLF